MVEKGRSSSGGGIITVGAKVVEDSDILNTMIVELIIVQHGFVGFIGEIACVRVCHVQLLNKI